MDATGRLNRRVAIQGPSNSVDAVGQPVIGWTTIATVWADIRELSGLETIKGGGDVSTVKASIRILRMSGVAPKMRVLFKATVYDIAAVLDSGQRHIDLVCVRVD